MSSRTTCTVCGSKMQSSIDRPVCRSCRRNIGGVPYGPRSGTPQHGTYSSYAHGCRCDECRAAARSYNAARYVEQVPTAGRCSQCGEPKWSKRARLCANCRDERKRAKRHRISHERRAAKYGVDAERFSPLEVFQRDKWRCHLCGKKVPRTATAPDPRAPSLDHVVPLALGGTHTRANVALAHLGCNIAKGTRPAGEQLALV